MTRAEKIFTRLPKGLISSVMAVEGPLLRKFANNTAGRFLVRHVTHGGLGRVGGRLGKAMGLTRRQSPVEVSMTLLRHFFAPFLVEEKFSKEEAVFCLRPCPYGWRNLEDAPLCDSAMQLERELVTSIGATLVIEETIPQGAPMCRFTLRSAP